VKAFALVASRQSFELQQNNHGGSRLKNGCSAKHTSVAFSSQFLVGSSPPLLLLLLSLLLSAFTCSLLLQLLLRKLHLR
jgi:hypothetical protein